MLKLRPLTKKQRDKIAKKININLNDIYFYNGRISGKTKSKNNKILKKAMELLNKKKPQ